MPRKFLALKHNNLNLFALKYLQKHEFVLEKTCFQGGFIFTKLLKSFNS